MTQISIIGPGKMGTAMAKILSTKYELQLCDIGVEPTADCIIFAVKPQDFKSCVAGLNTDFSDRLIISIMAGTNLETLEKTTGSTRLVRSLPNLPLQLGVGYTVWTTHPKTNGHDDKLAESIFEYMGGQIKVETEDQLNKLGILSGCGPAFFFHMAEMLEQRAQELGLSKEQAQELATQTALGSATLLKERSEKSASEWREAVCSKGGITIAALEKMWELGFKDAFFTGLDAAETRTLELSE